MSTKNEGSTHAALLTQYENALFKTNNWSFGSSQDDGSSPFNRRRPDVKDSHRAKLWNQLMFRGWLCRKGGIIIPTRSRHSWLKMGFPSLSPITTISSFIMSTSTTQDSSRRLVRTTTGSLPLPHTIIIYIRIPNLGLDQNNSISGDENEFHKSSATGYVENFEQKVCRSCSNEAQRPNQNLAYSSHI